MVKVSYLRLFLYLFLTAQFSLGCSQGQEQKAVSASAAGEDSLVLNTSRSKAEVKQRKDFMPEETLSTDQQAATFVAAVSEMNEDEKNSHLQTEGELQKLESLELVRQFDFGDESCAQLTIKAWEALGQNDYDAVLAYTKRCIDLYQDQAQKQQKSLTTFPAQEKQAEFAALNNVATSYFIRAEALMRQEEWEQARNIFRMILEDYSFAQYWDPRGWFWKVAEKSQESIDKIEKKISPQEVTGDLAQEKEIAEKTKPKPQASTLVLFDPGSEVIVDYAKYGSFKKVGTKDYHYNVRDQAGLARACGEGVYPNTTSVRKDPGYSALKGSPRLQGSHWDFLYTEDMQANFYKWNMATEPQGVKQFYIAFILERAGLLKQAVKAYYAIVVHFPGTVGWTYWHTPWYVGPVAVAKINYILRHHPELGMKLEGAKIRIENSFDNDVRNDQVICNPGRLIKCLPEELVVPKEDLIRLRIKRRIGGKHIQLVQYKNGHWQLLVDGQPYPLRAVTYTPTKIGQSPDEGTQGNWMKEDYNQNGRIDGPDDAWVDGNKNNKQDPEEKTIGDFQLMKEMGINAIRHFQPHYKVDKGLLSRLYEDYGIMTIMVNFLGAYAMESGASWYEGTDYTNPQHQKNMLASVKEMVVEFKDEPWVLFWQLGNENNYGVANNAKKNPQAFYRFVNKAAKLIHKLDPSRPVALCNGDVLFLDIFAQEAPEIDIFGANAYRGKEGFGNLWDDVRRITGKAAIITEYGCGAYIEGQEDLIYAEAVQAEYHRGCWEDIENNMAGSGAGNALGGIVFEWLDEWWKAYEPARHDWKGQFYGPFPDGFMHEEWLGLCGQGDGSNSPFLRTLRKSYFTYKEMWK